MVTHRLTVNGTSHLVEAPPDTPLLYVLRNELHLDAPQFGCGLGQCGACAVLAGRTQIRSCVTPVSIIRKPITTLEGLPSLWMQDDAARAKELHPLQQAWIDEQVPQCGYCQSGMIIQAADLLFRNPQPSEEEIRIAMDGHLCRCGTYLRIMRAIKRAASIMLTKHEGGRDDV